MTLNPTKSDVILFCTPQPLKSVPGLTSVRLDDSVIQCSDTVEILGATCTSLWDLTLRQQPNLISITYAPLGKSAHLWSY